MLWKATQRKSPSSWCLLALEQKAILFYCRWRVWGIELIKSLVAEWSPCSTFISQPKSHPNLLFFSGLWAKVFVWHSVTLWWSSATKKPSLPPSFSPSRGITGVHTSLPHSSVGILCLRRWIHLSTSAFRRKDWESFQNRLEECDKLSGEGREGVLTQSSQEKFEPTICLSFEFFLNLYYGK